MGSQDQMLITAIMQLNQNIVNLMRIIEKIQYQGINVITQESHRP